MGFLDSIINKGNCICCGIGLKALNYVKLMDGGCCYACEAKLSPFSHASKNMSGQSFMLQIKSRSENKKRWDNFNGGITLGEKTKFTFNSSKDMFFCFENNSNNNKVPDVFMAQDIARYEIKIEEKKKEIFYLDSNEEKHSFVPPYYGHAYDFYIMLYTNIPYVGNLKLKINTNPVDNNQPKIVKMGKSGVFNKIIDKAYTQNISMGKTSNADEVMNSFEYKKYQDMTNEIVESLKYLVCGDEGENRKRATLVKCPYCECMVPKYDNICKYCGGNIND